VGSEYLAERFSAPLNAGAEFGLFIAGRLRLGARALLPMADAYDNYEGEDGSSTFMDGQFRALDSKPPTLIWAGSVGFAAVATEALAISPSLYVLGSDVADYGVVVGLGIPFEWVNQNGFRIGFDFAVVRGIGGEVFAECEPFVSPIPCESGEIRAFDRPGSSGFFSHFYIGWAFATAKPY
jgi:hypothetical protein